MALNPRLERALLRQLVDAWKQLNGERFGHALRPPTLELFNSTKHLGQWVRQHRALRLSRTLVSTQPWGAVLEVLGHEMAHQYVHEVLHIEEAPHGPAFRKVCAERGLDGRPSGLPEPDAAERSVQRKVRRLLALAGSDNPHEAQSAMNAAQRLMLKHNLSPPPAERRFVHDWVGEPMVRRPVHIRILAGILCQHFFVTAVWVQSYLPARAKWGLQLELSGTPTNLEIARWVHGYLLETGERLWQAHKRREGLVSNKPRRRFLAGVFTGFHQKLADHKVAAEQEGLVWVGDPALEGYVGRRHGRLRSARRSTVRVDDAFHHGRAAGKRIVLHRPVEERGSGGGGLLGG